MYFSDIYTQLILIIWHRLQVLSRLSCRAWSIHLAFEFDFNAFDVVFSDQRTNGPTDQRNCHLDRNASEVERSRI